MAITIKLTFPGGRYHATPWGRHVNEGVPEWPPSPWRLLRALVAVWKRTCPTIAEEQIKQMLAAISEPPRFALPPHRLAHTRHYMPWEKKNPYDRTLVFDTFVSVNRNDPLFIGWPDAELPYDALADLGKLLANLARYGRAESWTIAELAEDQPTWNCVPASESEFDPESVFCPNPATMFGDEYYPTLDGKKLAKGKVKLSEFLYDCPRWHLCLDTETLHKKKWPAMPGARWINYTRPPTCDVIPATHRSQSRPKPTVIHFIIDGPVLPLATDTIRIAEAMRNAAMSQFRQWCGRYPEKAGQYLRTDSPEQYASPVLSGKEYNGSILHAHRHAYYLPITGDDDPRHITRVIVFAREGFTEAELTALSKISFLYDGKYRVQLIGVGYPPDFADPIFGKSSEWYSLTPYIGPAHIGRGAQQRFLRKAIRREWRRLSEQIDEFHDIQLQEIVALPLNDSQSNRPHPFLFRRNRLKHNGEKLRALGIYKLIFSRLLTGPLSLGYGSHFGLGLFAALDD